MVFPKEVDFDQASRGLYTNENESVLAEHIDSIQAGKSVSIIVESTINRKAKVDNSIVVTGVVEYKDAGADKTVLGYALHNVVKKNRDSQVAGVLFGDSGFMPNTVFEIIITILIIGGLIFGGRMLYGKYVLKKKKPSSPDDLFDEDDDEFTPIMSNNTPEPEAHPLESLYSKQGYERISN